MKPPVRSKTDMYRRWQAGEFGECIPTYYTLQEAMASPCRTMAIRCLDPGSPFCVYDIPKGCLRLEVNAMLTAGADVSRMVFNSCDNDDDHILLQGEVIDAPGGWHLRYSTVKRKTRIALAEDEQNAHGLRAKAICRKPMDPASYDELCNLLDDYPGHIVEFSCWRVPQFGMAKSTIFWEVRTY